MSRASRQAKPPSRLPLLPVDAELRAAAMVPRPTTRAECPTVRPCPWVGCSHHLLLDLHGGNTGSAPTLRLNGRSVLGLRRSAPAMVIEAFIETALERLEQLEHSCSLDAAEEGGRPMHAVAELLGVVKQRVVQEETSAKQKLAAFVQLKGEPEPRRRVDAARASR